MTDKSINFYVYEHWRPDKDVCFYVGLGRGRRANDMFGRNRYHKNIQKKLSGMGMCVEVRLYREGLSREEAVTIEVERITYWKSIGVQLSNLTAGGDGIHDPTPETRELMRRARIGWNPDSETRAKISAGRKRHLAKPGIKEAIGAKAKARMADPEAREYLRSLHKGKSRPAEVVSKIAASLKGRKMTPDQIEKMRLTKLGRKQSPELIEKRRAANLGKKRSEEFCAQMRAMWSDERKVKQAEINRARMTPEWKEKAAEIRRKQNQSPEFRAKLKAAWVIRKAKTLAKEEANG